MGRKKSKARRQKRINSTDVQIKSKLTSPPSKFYFQCNVCPIRPNNKITSVLGINEERFPELPILSNSMQELYPYDAESFLTSGREVASCDDLPLTSTLTPLPSSLELRELEADALRMDGCCSFRLDSAVFKDSVPCLGNHLQDDMTQILNSLHPKTAFSFRSKIRDLSLTIDQTISTYNSVCRNAAVRIDMLTAEESLLIEKVSRQRSQIEELEKKIEKLVELASEDNPGASAKFNKQHAELDQKDMLATKESSLAERVFMKRSKIKLIKKIENLMESISDDNPGALAQFEKQHAELDQNNMLATGKSILTEKKSIKRSKIEELKKEIENLIELVSEDNPGVSAMFNKQHPELDQKDISTTKDTLLTEKVSMQRSQIQELENRIEKQIQLVNEAKPCATDYFEKQHAESDQNGVSTTKESLLTENVSTQRSQIELENKTGKLTELISETNARASDKFEIDRNKLGQKDKITGFRVNKIEQNFKLDKGDKAVISITEAESQKVGGFKKHCFELEKKDTTIQHLKEAVSLEVSKLDTDKTSDSHQNLETKVISTSRKNLIAERKTEIETDINEFEKILELGRHLNKSMRSIQKAREIRSIQNETKSLNMTVEDPKISRQEALVEVKSLKSQIAALTEQLHSNTRILPLLNSECSSLRNEKLFQSTVTQESEKSIEVGNDDFKRLDMLLLSLQEKNKALKQNSTQLKIEMSNSTTSRCLRENLPLPRDRYDEMEVQKMNLLKNNRTQQILHKDENNSSSHFSTTEGNKENFEFGSNFVKNVNLNSILIHHPDDSERNISTANSLHKVIQNLLQVIEVQELSLLQQSTYVRKLAQEISSIKQQNSSLSQRLRTNETKLALIEVEVGLTSSRSTIVECDTSMQKFEDTVVKNRDLHSLRVDIASLKNENKTLKENLTKVKKVQENEMQDKLDDFNLHYHRM